MNWFVRTFKTYTHNARIAFRWNVYTQPTFMQEIVIMSITSTDFR